MGVSSSLHPTLYRSLMNSEISANDAASSPNVNVPFSAISRAPRKNAPNAARVNAEPTLIRRTPAAARFATVMAERLASEFVVEHVPEALCGRDALLLAHHQRAVVAGIASGAAEIQLNLIASELLHLPREPR